jgi:3-oxoadipate enol-lactonase
MLIIPTEAASLHVRSDGPEDGRPVIFANSLGTDFRVWDPLLPHLPAGLRLVRYDKRGHGLSDCPPGPYRIEDLVAEAAAVADALGLRGATFIGLSIGGLIGQGLALARPDIVAALVLMDTAAKIGTPAMWAERIAAIEGGGIEAIADGVLDRWFAPRLRRDPVALAPWRNMLTRTPRAGYTGCCAAIAGADFTDRIGTLAIPVMAMAGEADQATPPDLVRATAALCKAPFHLIADAGHLPCVERPEDVARLIADFLETTRHG